MNLLTKDIINDVALSTGVAPSYIEKDWYLVQILNVVSKLNTGNTKIIFAGGTCLSKAYQLTKRFSEDIDFVVIGLENKTRKERAQYRENLIKKINQIDLLKVEMDTISSRDENRFSNFYVNYPKNFELGQSLRNNLKIEISFKSTYIPSEKKHIKTFVGEFFPNSPEADIDCISCIETAANKFNALLWRVDIKDRTQPFNHMTNDPALMRHLYDLNLLYPSLVSQPKFVALVKEIYKDDCKRGDKNRQLSFSEFCLKTIEILRTDANYKREYEQFVSKMVYDTSPQISFEDALRSYENLIKEVLK